jgi:hypothetical protein
MYMNSRLHSRLYRLGLGLLLLAAALAGPAQPAPPAVRALLFYGPECADCQDLFRYLLPALTERYGARLVLAAIDTGAPDGETLYRAASHYGLPAERTALPAAVVGGKALVGLNAIAVGLGDRFESLATDPAATAWAVLPGLDAMLPQAVQNLQAQVAAQAVPPTLPEQAPASGHRDRIANGLAVAVLVGMVLALLHSLVRVRRPQGVTRPNTFLIPLAVLVGLGISAYTAYTSLADIAPVCGPIGSCAAVQQSEYTKLFGIPMGVLAGRAKAPTAGRRLALAAMGHRPVQRPVLHAPDSPGALRARPHLCVVPGLRHRHDRPAVAALRRDPGRSGVKSGWQRMRP